MIAPTLFCNIYNFMKIVDTSISSICGEIE